MMPIIITHSAAVMAVRLIGSVVFLSVSIFEQQMGGVQLNQLFEAFSFIRTVTVRLQCITV